MVFPLFLLASSFGLGRHFVAEAERPPEMYSWYSPPRHNLLCSSNKRVLSDPECYSWNVADSGAWSTRLQHPSPRTGAPNWLACGSSRSTACGSLERSSLDGACLIGGVPTRRSGMSSWVGFIVSGFAYPSSYKQERKGEAQDMWESLASWRPGK